MKNDIPALDDLMQGINDPDIILADESPDMLEPTPQSHKEETTEENTEAVLSPQVEQERYWNDFLKHLEASDEQNDKSERLVCRLDRDLADSLDDCVIYNRSRSDMVNAIVRSFFDAYLPQLAQFRREKKSLVVQIQLSMVIDPKFITICQSKKPLNYQQVGFL